MDTKAIKNQSSLAGSMGVGKVGPAAEADRLKKIDEAAMMKKLSQKRADAGDWNIDVSPRAKELAESHRLAGEITRNTPDVREDRVADLKAKIASGEYQIDSGKIADGIFREAMMEQLADPSKQG